MLILLMAFSLLLVLAFLTIAFSFGVGLIVVLMAITLPALMFLKDNLRHSTA
ncbi:MAG: hypothetical protein ABI977_17820 [Acidobacteriota bacterium]